MLYTNKKKPFITQKSNNKIHKSKYYRKYKITTYFTKDCFYLFPEKAPKGFNPNRKQDNKPVLEQSTKALITIGKDLELMDLDPQEQVYNIT